MFRSLLIVIFAILISGCETEDIEQDKTRSGFSTQADKILYNGEAVTLNGVNSLQTFGLMQADLYTAWNVKISREFIGNLKEQPITGDAILSSQNKWLHSLEKIVAHNRSLGMVTILCPFGWVNNAGEQILFTGLNPSAQAFFDEYLIKMRAIAEHFKGQDDVWIEVWNEPYSWTNGNSYSHELWLSDIRLMVSNLRNIAGFDNIILVPGNAQGQSEEVLFEQASQLQAEFSNLLFDLHAYEKWLLDNSQLEIENRLTKIQDAKIPVIFGEIGVINSSGLMPVEHFLAAAKKLNISVLAWVFNANSDDQNALLNNDLLPNENNNLFWGTTFKSYLSN